MVARRGATQQTAVMELVPSRGAIECEITAQVKGDAAAVRRQIARLVPAFRAMAASAQLRGPASAKG